MMRTVATQPLPHIYPTRRRPLNRLSELAQEFLLHAARYKLSASLDSALPDVGPNRPRIQRRSKHLCPVANIKLLRRIAHVDHNQYLFPIWRFESNVWQWIEIVGADSNRPRPDKLRSMSNRVVRDVASHRVAIN